MMKLALDNIHCYLSDKMVGTIFGMIDRLLSSETQTTTVEMPTSHATTFVWHQLLRDIDCAMRDTTPRGRNIVIDVGPRRKLTNPKLLARWRYMLEKALRKVAPSSLGTFEATVETERATFDVTPLFAENHTRAGRAALIVIAWEKKAFETLKLVRVRKLPQEGENQ